VDTDPAVIPDPAAVAAVVVVMGAAVTAPAVPVPATWVEHPASAAASSATVNGFRAVRINAPSIE
jgi:hypothetical protein